MSCDICGRNSCISSFHSLEEQEKYKKVIVAFDLARSLHESLIVEEKEEEEEEEK